MPRSRAAPSSPAASSSERARSPATSDHTASPSSLATRSVEPMRRERTRVGSSSGEGIGDSMAQASTDNWFLTAAERGNPATDIDRRRGAGTTRPAGNRREALGARGAGALVGIAGGRGDPDELLDGEGTELGKVLAELAGRGVQVRGLLWRSHPELAHFQEGENLHLGEVVNEAGGEILLDERVRGPGSQHQKLVLVRHPDREDEDVAFMG